MDGNFCISKEHRKKLSDGQNKKAVIGTFLNNTGKLYFSSLIEAASFLKVPVSSHIIECCKGKRKSFCGCAWTLANDISELELSKIKEESAILKEKLIDKRTKTIKKKYLRELQEFANKLRYSQTNRNKNLKIMRKIKAIDLTNPELVYIFESIAEGIKLLNLPDNAFRKYYKLL